MLIMLNIPMICNAYYMKNSYNRHEFHQKYRRFYPKTWKENEPSEDKLLENKFIQKSDNIYTFNNEKIVVLESKSKRKIKKRKYEKLIKLRFEKDNGKTVTVKRFWEVSVALPMKRGYNWNISLIDKNRVKFLFRYPIVNEEEQTVNYHFYIKEDGNTLLKFIQIYNGAGSEIIGKERPLRKFRVRFNIQ